MGVQFKLRIWVHKDSSELKASYNLVKRWKYKKTLQIYLKHTHLWVRIKDFTVFFFFEKKTQKCLSTHLNTFRLDLIGGENFEHKMNKLTIKLMRTITCIVLQKAQQCFVLASIAPHALPLYVLFVRNSLSIDHQNVDWTPSIGCDQNIEHWMWFVMKCMYMIYCIFAAALNTAHNCSTPYTYIQKYKRFVNIELNTEKKSQHSNHVRLVYLNNLSLKFIARKW